MKLISSFLAGIPALKLYVSTTGSDSNNGSELSPFLTIQKAKDEVRTYIANNYTGAIEVLLNGGRYDITDKLDFTNLDSGNDNLTITYKAMDFATPVISGGRTVSSITDNAGIWEFNLSNPYDGGYQDIYVNDRRVKRANTGYVNVTSASVSGDIGGGKYRRTIGLDSSLVTTLNNLTALELEQVTGVYYKKWHHITFKIETINTTTNTITSVGDFMTSTAEVGTDIRLFFENIPSTLTTKGEFIFDGTVYKYYPLDGETIGGSEINIPILNRFIEFTGTNSNLLNNVSFNGLTIKYSSYLLTPFNQQQAAYNTNPLAYFNFTKNTTISECIFEKTGQHSIRFEEGCINNTIYKNLFDDLGGGGIYIGQTSSTNEGDYNLYPTTYTTADNNIIRNGGKNIATSVGIMVGESSNNTVTHNDISNLFYTGITNGWEFIYGNPSQAYSNTIKWNHIYDLNLDGLLDDLGGIYNTSSQPNTIIENNIIHDIDSYSYGGWGLYLDQSSQFMNVKDNLVYNTKNGGIQQNQALGNFIRNNIFCYGTTDQLRFTGDTPLLNRMTFENNIVLASEGDLMTLTSVWNAQTFTMDENVYFYENSVPFDFAGNTLTQWRAKGYDINSVVDNPGTLDEINRTFNLNTTVTDQINFVEFDTSNVGVYGSAWKTIAES